ncbi:MAG: helix-turn-helix domain-containing protein [Novosphingobium sp.]|nr:helix-turn-helix domain-containing protein [Novosphingobium sp.]
MSLRLAMTFREIFERFASRYLPGNQSDAALLRYQSLARAIEAKPDSPVRLDENCDHLAFVCCGATKLVAHASGGREQIVAFHFPDELVVVPARAEHAYTLSSVKGSELLVFDYQELLDLARNDPLVLRMLLDCSRKSLIRCRNKSLALGRKTAAERVASFLAGMAVRIGMPEDDCVFLDLPMSRRDIADSLGLTVETISRQITQLRSLDIVSTVGKSGVRIDDLRGLEARAGYLIASG